MTAAKHTNDDYEAKMAARELAMENELEFDDMQSSETYLYEMDI